MSRRIGTPILISEGKWARGFDHVNKAGPVVGSGPWSRPYNAGTIVADCGGLCSALTAVMAVRGSAFVGRHLTVRRNVVITGMNHTGFIVRDLDRATEFYRDVMGMLVVGTKERQGEPISQVVGYENTRLKRTMLSVGDNHLLELIQYLHPSGEERPSEERNTLGATHLALDVDDIQQMYQHIIERGARKLNPPVELEPGRLACYLQDPDGNWVELIQTSP